MGRRRRGNEEKRHWDSGYTCAAPLLMRSHWDTTGNQTNGKYAQKTTQLHLLFFFFTGCHGGPLSVWCFSFVSTRVCIYTCVNVCVFIKKEITIFWPHDTTTTTSGSCKNLKKYQANEKGIFLKIKKKRNNKELHAIRRNYLVCISLFIVEFLSSSLILSRAYIQKSWWIKRGSKLRKKKILRVHATSRKNTVFLSCGPKK